MEPSVKLTGVALVSVAAAKSWTPQTSGTNRLAARHRRGKRSGRLGTGTGGTYLISVAGPAAAVERAFRSGFPSAVPQYAGGTAQLQTGRAADVVPAPRAERTSRLQQQAVDSITERASYSLAALRSDVRLREFVG